MFNYQNDRWEQLHHRLLDLCFHTKLGLEEDRNRDLPIAYGFSLLLT